jgi:SAM-dependent methyltransferase
MELAAEYRGQFAWRPWPQIFAALPMLAGRTVLDLGCGPGDQAAELVARGARVIGIDANPELIAAASARGLPNAEFRLGDLRALDPDLQADGLWSSFAAAYFPDLSATLVRWGAHLGPGGFVALTEIDDLFGHEPLAGSTRERLDAYARAALAAGWYDFHMGRKLAGHLARAGFMVEKTLILEDQELAFDGPAAPAVLQAWRQRFDRMAGLQRFCGPAFEPVLAEFVAGLAHPSHRARAKVHCVVAVKSV